jgi:hypothetical protein
MRFRKGLVDAPRLARGLEGFTRATVKFLLDRVGSSLARRLAHMASELGGGGTIIGLAWAMQFPATWR